MGTTGSSSTVHRVLVFVLVTLSLSHVAFAAFEALNRPLFAWDATMNWATKSRVWFFKGELVPFIEKGTWLEIPNPTAFTSSNDDYPATVPLLHVWIAVAIARWSEVEISLPWPFMMVALVLLIYGEGRALRGSRLEGAAFAYFVASLPMVGANVALAGLADVFAGLLLLSVVSTLYRAVDRSDAGYFLLAGIFAISLATTKNEGVFWVLAVVAGFVFAALPSLKLKLGVSAAALIGAVLFAVALSSFTVGGNSFESLDVYFRMDGAQALFERTLATDSWHLAVFVWAAAVLTWACLRVPRTSINSVGFAVLIMLTFYAFLFTFTLYARGAISGAATARVLLQLAPSLTFLTVLTWGELARLQINQAEREQPNDG